MRFKDPKTGTRLASIEAAFIAFCDKWACFSPTALCPMFKLLEGNGTPTGRRQCLMWAKSNPTVFAELAGYEIDKGKYLTDHEIAIMKAVGAKYVSYDVDDDQNVILWTGKPERVELDFVWFSPTADAKAITCINKDLFPSVPMGECLGLE